MKIHSLQLSIDCLVEACQNHGVSVDEYLSWPFEQIVSFADQHAIPLLDLREICSVMMERLDAVDRMIRSGSYALH